MSDHPRVQQNELKRVRICDDVLYDTFRLVDSVRLGLKVALVSVRFDGLVEAHLSARKWTIGSFDIRRSEEHGGAEIVIRNGDGTETEVPISQPVPKSVVGFKQFTISYVDGTVLEFLRQNQHLFKLRINLSICLLEHKRWLSMAEDLWPLVSNGNINALCLYNGLSFMVLRNTTASASAAAPCDCVAQWISYIGQGYDRRHKLGQSPQGSPNANVTRPLLQWLHIYSMEPMLAKLKEFFACINLAPLISYTFPHLYTCGSFQYSELFSILLNPQKRRVLTYEAIVSETAKKCACVKRWLPFRASNNNGKDWEHEGEKIQFDRNAVFIIFHAKQFELPYDLPPINPNVLSHIGNWFAALKEGDKN